MRDKKNKNKSQLKNENKSVQKTSHNFEVHTMIGDNELNKNNPTKGAPPAALAGAVAQQTKQPPIAKKKNQTESSQNPFLTKEVEQLNKDTKKGSFAPGKQKEPVEKINYTPDDIVLKGKSKSKSKKNQKKSMNLIMIILIIIFLLGAIGFAVYFFLFNKTEPTTIETPDSTETPIEIPNTDIDENEDDAGDFGDIEQTYSLDLPNYFSFNVESETSQVDITTELDVIEKNMKEQDIMGPISFIVTDMNNNPVSFHVFAMSAGITLSQDVLSALEEDFEIYAYNDAENGVRFGFIINAKSTDALQTAITATETTLPEAFDIILGGMGGTAVNVVFNDSSYDTHPIRYFNLNSEESYSVDYTINDVRWVVGSSKNTMRAMLDALTQQALPVDAIVEENESSILE